MSLVMGIEQKTVVISSGTSLSAEVATGAKTLVGIGMPAAWDTGGITFLVSVDGGVNWLDLYDPAGVNYALVVAAAQYILIDPVVFAGINDIKVQSGTTGSPVTQSADRTLTLILRPL